MSNWAISAPGFGVGGFGTQGFGSEWEEIHEMIDETRDWQTLTLTFRSDIIVVEEVLRRLDRSTEKVEIVEGADGSFKAISRGSPVVTLRPPDGRSDLREEGDFVIDGYTESLEDQQAAIYEIEIEALATGPKSSVADPPEADHDPQQEWLFEFADGDIATDRIEKDVGRGGDTVDGRVEVLLTLSNEEAAIVEGSLNRLGATRIREVPDGDDLAEDNTDDDRNHVTVTTPTERDPEERIIETGEYIATAFNTGLINDRYSPVSLVLYEKA